MRFNSGNDPVLYLSNPPGITSERRRAMLDDVAALNRLNFAEYQDPETQSRIDQYEMAFRMQAAVPELADLSKEPASLFDRYGPESRKPGTYAANCILARRLAERGVRFIQLYHRGWDQHTTPALHLLGFDHPRLTYRFQGRDYRLTDVHGEVVKDILA